MPGNGTWVHKEADCDLCRPLGEVVIARFDAKLAHCSAWGNLCARHWSLNCARKLGTGIGQMLVREGEDPSSIAVSLDVDDLVIVKFSERKLAGGAR